MKVKPVQGAYRGFSRSNNPVIGKLVLPKLKLEPQTKE
jgi:hypothetical protein